MCHFSKNFVRRLITSIITCSEILFIEPSTERTTIRTTTGKSDIICLNYEIMITKADQDIRYPDNQANICIPNDELKE